MGTWLWCGFVDGLRVRDAGTHNETSYPSSSFFFRRKLDIHPTVSTYSLIGKRSQRPAQKEIIMKRYTIPRVAHCSDGCPIGS